MSNLSIVGQGALSYWMPAKVCYPSSARLPRYMPLSMRSIYDALRFNGWRFYVTESKLGYCHQDKKVITIPLSVLGQPVEHVAYMLAHEMAHAHTSMDAQSHGVEFLANFLAIAPRNLWPLEPAYKPVFERGTRASITRKSAPNNNIVLSLKLVPTTKKLMS